MCPAAVFESTTQVTWPDPTVSDNFVLMPQVNCIPFDNFQEGETEVTCTATDDVNNMASCMFTVTVGMIFLVFTILIERLIKFNYKTSQTHTFITQIIFIYE